MKLKEYQNAIISDRIPSEIEEIQGRELDRGGYSIVPGGPYRPDATAWAVIALEASGVTNDRLTKARERLAGSQRSDGRVVFSSRLGAAYWATPLAVLAWANDPQFQNIKQKSADFLLATGGHHEAMTRDPIFGHDPTLRGWPWIEGTHSWIEPTSVTVLALRACGRKHERMDEAVSMILDRQLASGGWNYGNTTVFGTELWPIPECTGLALNAMSGLVPKDRILRSLGYMESASTGTRTPLALSWGILGLGSWAERPEGANEWIEESLALQNRYGSYDTTLLAQLVVAYHASAGLLSLFRERESGG
ncbi:MAG: hypothetical protein JXB23_02995 [Candidatus Aminicenantes bacterium]|nr:hypothetical protein [Candidatus Aminicenantes bacterium]